MDFPLATWVIVTFVIFFGFLTLTVESQQNVNFQSPPPPPPPPPVSPPPPPPQLSPPPPPVSPSPPSPSSPPPRSPPPPHRSSPHAPPPPRKRLGPPKSGNSARNRNNGHNQHSGHKKLSPPTKEKRLNFGKKIGLFFIGIIAVLQVCVVAFLVIKRRQLLRAESRL